MLATNATEEGATESGQPQGTISNPELLKPLLPMSRFGRSIAGTGRQLAGWLHGDLLHGATLAACISRPRWRQWMPGLRACGEEDVGEAVECEPESHDRHSGFSPALSRVPHNACMRPVLRSVCAIEGATTRSCAQHAR
jgi:hypothetical protein